MSNEAEKWYHADPGRFVDALRFAATQTGFSERLIEKDYFCSLILHDLAALFHQGLVFKGGTCLSKIHAEFFRLSEDLDFCVSILPGAPRSQRREASLPFRHHLAALAVRHALFEMAEEIREHNHSRQYNGRLAYRSGITGEHEYIKVELSLREETVLPTEIVAARTLLRDLNSEQPVLPMINVRVLHIREAYAEKIRAALTRREPAIRDFFDIDYAIGRALFDHRDPVMLDLLGAKLLIPGTDPVDLSEAKIAILHGQLETQLRPVLRTADYDAFDLQRVVDVLHELMR